MSQQFRDCGGKSIYRSSGENCNIPSNLYDQKKQVDSILEYMSQGLDRMSGGPQGVQGPSGFGLQGAQGIQGASNGPPGIQGTQGIQGLGIQGVQGTRGLQGVQGSGIQGPQGSQGTTGIQGVSGALSSQGAQGIQGFQGSQGLLGVQGVSGTLGSQGAQGFQGSQGLLGAQGVSGTLGSQGAQGFQGSQGLLGAQGVSGTLGSQGIQGIQGGSNISLRTNTSYTTAALAQYGVADFTMNLGKLAELVAIQVSEASWVRIYRSDAQRTADPRATAGGTLQGIIDLADNKPYSENVTTSAAQTIIQNPTPLLQGDSSGLVYVRLIKQSTGSSAVTLTTTTLLLEN